MGKEKIIRVGVVGCGAIAQLQHIPSLHHMKGVQIAALCDKDNDLLFETGKKYGIAKRYNDFSEMLSNEELDMVDICTPPQTHHAMCIEAAESGCHIVVEKPVTLTIEEFDQVAAACASNRVKLCQIQNKMFEPVMLAAITQVNSGSIGDVLGVNIQLLVKRTAEQALDPGHWCHGLPAGIFTEILPHPIYLAQIFLGPVEPMEVHIAHVGPKNQVIYNALAVILEGENGIGTVDYSGPYPKNKVIVNVYGTLKSLRIDLFNSTKVEFGMGGAGRAARAFENLKQGFSVLTNTASTTSSVLTGRFHSGHYNIINGFIQSIRNGTEQPVSMEQAREVIRVLERIAQMIEIQASNDK